LCVELFFNQAIVDEEFETLLEYVEHQLLSKVVMGLETTWKESKAQTINEYVH
jgi:hypothetical protein